MIMPLILAFRLIFNVQSSRALCQVVDGLSGVILFPLADGKTEFTVISVSLKGPE